MISCFLKLDEKVNEKFKENGTFKVARNQFSFFNLKESEEFENELEISFEKILQGFERNEWSNKKNNIEVSELKFEKVDKEYKIIFKSQRILNGNQSSFKCFFCFMFLSILMKFKGLYEGKKLT